MKLYTIIFSIIFSLIASTGMAANRALVIGNDAYTELPSLIKAIEDAEGYAALLDTQGFDVTLVRNGSMAEMRMALARFYDSIQPGDTAIFIYSGHGWSDGVQNFLVPTDTARLASPSLAAEFSIPLKNGANGILDNIARRGATLSVSIIDACRNNPFDAALSRSTGVTRGLAPIEPAEGTFLVFSAGAGQAALDRLGEADTQQYSVFTRFFLRNLAQSGDLREATIQTRSQVQAAADIVGANQRPAYYDELSGTSCLFGDCNAAVVAPEVTVETRTTGVIDEWMFVQNSNSIAVLNAFIAKWPDEPLYIALAQEILDSIETVEVASNTPPPPEQPDEVEPVSTTRIADTAQDNPDETVQRMDSIEQEALDFLVTHAENWSRIDQDGLDAVGQAYARRVDYFGNDWSRRQVWRDKQNFAERWPVRRYGLDQDTANILCINNMCTVEIQGTFFAHSPERNASSRGLAAHVYIIDMSGPPEIAAESSDVIARY